MSSSSKKSAHDVFMQGISKGQAACCPFENEKEAAPLERFNMLLVRESYITRLTAKFAKLISSKQQTRLVESVFVGVQKRDALDLAVIT